MKRKGIKYWTLIGIFSASLVSAISYSSDSRANNGLLSKGRLEYNNSAMADAIILDASDHTYLKNSIDTLALKVTALEKNNTTNDSIGEDANGMSVHEKLDYLMQNSGGTLVDSVTGSIIHDGTGSAYSSSSYIGTQGYDKLIIYNKSKEFALSITYADGTTGMLSERGTEITTTKEFDISNSTQIRYAAFVNLVSGKQASTSYELRAE